LIIVKAVENFSFIKDVEDVFICWITPYIRLSLILLYTCSDNDNDIKKLQRILASVEPVKKKI
jgi:hypothetical protein